MPDPFFRRNLAANRIAAELFGDDIVLHQFFFDFARIGAGFIHLIDGDDDRAVGGFGVANGFDGLRHDAIIGGHDENDDIGHRSAAGSHRGEGRVPRGVDDRDLLAMDFLLISADRLSDLAGFVGATSL
jgi:hypothetical protein